MQILMIAQVRKHKTIVAKYIAREELDLLVLTQVVKSTLQGVLTTSGTYDIKLGEEVITLVTWITSISSHFDHWIQQLSRGSTGNSPLHETEGKKLSLAICSYNTTARNRDNLNITQ